MKQKLFTAALLVLLAGFNSHLTPLQAQGTAFTYQGRLDAAGSPANGIYDLQFALFDAASGGTQQSGTWTQLTQGVTNGLFTVELDFGSFFPGASRWLQIGVRTNGGSSFTTLTPRQKFAATPYAITAGNFSGSITAAQLPAGVVTNSASGVNLTGNFSGNGANVTNVNAATLGGVSSAGFWKTNGNTGANPATGAFLGTADNLPLEFRVNGARALRLEPNTNGAPNVIGGSPANTVATLAEGATIAGGGLGLYPNTIVASYATIGGGTFNTVAGGWATIGGGRDNNVTGSHSTLSGGSLNMIHTNADFATIGGGVVNTIQTNARFSTISGGQQNTIQANANHATINGGNLNTIQTNANFATIGGGKVNQAAVEETTVAGGAFNSALAFSATVGGGGGNAASGEWSTIAGGRDNLLTNANYATISGGWANLVKTNAAFSTIPGGLQNEAGGAYGFAAGRRAKASHTGAFVWADSTDADFTSTGNNQFLIRAAGGVGINHNNPNGAALAVNGEVAATFFRGDGTYLTGVALRDFGNQFTGDQSISGNLTVSESIAVGSLASAGYAAAAIGQDAQASGNYSTAIGASTRATASYGMALGFGSQADHMGSFVWADATFTGFASTAPHQFLIRAFGGVGINKNNPATALDVNGTVTATSFSGSGAGLTGLNAANLTGTILDARLSSNVALRSGGNAFTGNQTITGGVVGIGTSNPQGTLHVYSANNPTVMRIQSSGTPGFGRVEFVSNPQGDVNEWRPGYIQSTDNGSFTGGLAFFVNGAGAGNKFGSNEVMRVVNGAVGIGTATPVSALQVVGTVTATAFNPPSDRNLKENFAPVSPREVLEKVATLPISRWNFKADAATPHVGPMAQDFHAAFGLGTDERHIATVDADGVALAAIQGLNEKVEAKNAEITELKRELENLKQVVNRLVQAKN